MILRIILAYVVFGEDLTGRECAPFKEVFQTENTGITVMTYEAESRPAWTIKTWNDHAHLREV